MSNRTLKDQLWLIVLAMVSGIMAYAPSVLYAHIEPDKVAYTAIISLAVGIIAICIIAATADSLKTSFLAGIFGYISIAFVAPIATFFLRDQALTMMFAGSAILLSTAAGLALRVSMTLGWRETRVATYMYLLPTFFTCFALGVPLYGDFSSNIAGMKHASTQLASQGLLLLAGFGSALWAATVIEKRDNNQKAMTGTRPGTPPPK